MAKATTLADSLGKHLECAVCLEQYTEPKVLPCLHSFCKRCLQGLLTQEGAVFKINCPTCRSSAEWNSGGVLSLVSSPGLTGNSKFNWTNVASSDSQNPQTDTTPFVEGLVGFSAGKHTWKVKIFGSVLQGFCFGIRNHSMSDGSQLGNWWVWSSKQVHQLLSLLGGQARRESTITDLVSGDTIELYLDCEKETLTMYNPRTKQSDTLDEVTGEVFPVFRMTTHEDQVSLKVL